MNRVIAIVGPTAAGKTKLSLELAQQIGGEIVNLDAYQVYKGMDIGTAKPSVAERLRVPHHLIDVLDIHDAASVVEFERLAAAAIADIHARGLTAICVGGSGMYVRAVLDVLDVPPTNPAVRAKYQSLLEEVGAEALHARLAELDADAAALILPGNTRRVVRALEVVELTGRFQAALPAPEPRYVDVRIGLQVPRDQLRARIAARVEQMFVAGWIEEVRSLVADGLLQTPTAAKAIGYAEVAKVLSGELTQTLAAEQITAATLKFSKRQLQWFKRDNRVQWLAYDDGELLEHSRALLSAV